LTAQIGNRFQDACQNASFIIAGTTVHWSLLLSFTVLEMVDHCCIKLWFSAGGLQQVCSNPDKYVCEEKKKSHSHVAN